MKTETLAYAIGNIDERLIERAEKPVSRRPRYLRYIAAAAALLLVAGAAFSIVNGVQKERVNTLNYAWDNLPEGYEFMAEISVPKDAILPKIQSETSIGELQYHRCYSIREAYQIADAACIITVKDCLGETNACTYYDVKLEMLFKGDLPENFTICQLGNSSFHPESSPLFTYGDKLLIFLRPWGNEGYENSYDLIGTDAAMFYVASSGTGDVYLIDHKGVFSLKTEERCPELHLTNYVFNEELSNELFDYIGSFDKAMEEHLRLYREATIEEYTEFMEFDEESKPLHIYSLDEIERLFQE